MGSLISTFKKDAREMAGDNEEVYEIALVMMASMQVGCNSAKIKKFTGLRSDTCQLVCRKTRYHKIWVKGAKVLDGKLKPTDTLHHSGWDDPKTGGTAFICDVMVVQGMLTREPD